MSMCFFRVIIFSSLMVACLCDRAKLDRKRPPHHHHEYSLFHEFHHLHYLIFLALKVKVILVIGTIWAFALLFGKVFAVIKMTEYMKKNYIHDDHHHEEKIVYASPPYGSPGFSYGSPYGSPYQQGVYGKSYGVSAPLAPETIQPTTEVYDNVQQSYGPPTSGRSSEDGAGIYEYFKMFSRVIRQMNVTEVAFKDMHLYTEDCKKKFVCEADFNAKQSYVLSTAFNILSDDSYHKYKTNRTISTIEECAKLYSDCDENI